MFLRKVALVNPPNPPGLHMNREMAGGLGTARPWKRFLHGRQRDPSPLTLLYTAAVAEREGCETCLIDAPFQGLSAQGVLNAVAKASPKGIGVLVSLPSLDYDLNLASQIKANSPQSAVFLFGSVIQTTWEQWAGKTNTDYLLYGEPESIMAQFLAGDSKEEREKAGAFAVGDLQAGRISLQGVPWRLAEDLDALPFPAWHLGPYRANGQPGPGKLFYVNTGRGCPRNCAMCPYVLHQGRHRRTRSPESVLAELEYLSQNMGARHILFRDPNICMDRDWLSRILQGIVDARLSLDITFEADIESLDSRTLYLCKLAGVSHINTGIESGASACLSEIGQNPRYLEKLESSTAICRRLGINVVGFFMVGFANECWDSVFTTLELSKRLDISAKFFIMAPYFGTKLREAAQAEGRLLAHWHYRDFNSETALMSTRYLTPADVHLAMEFLSRETQVRQLRKAVALVSPWLKPRSFLVLVIRLVAARARASIARLRVRWRHKKAAKGQRLAEMSARPMMGEGTLQPAHAMDSPHRDCESRHNERTVGHAELQDSARH